MSPYSRRYLLQLLRELEVPIPKGWRPGRPRALTVAQETQVLRRLRRGERQTVIAQDLGVSRHTLRRLCKRRRF